MKIRIIQAAQLDSAGKPIKYRKMLSPSITLATLAGLTPRGHDVRLLDDYVEDIDFDDDVELAAVTAQTCHAPRAYQIADEFRKRGVPTVTGGFHASACPEEALEHFDAVVVGEAEAVWDKVIEDAREGRLKGVYEASEFNDLSRPVVPCYHLFDYRNYVVPPFAKTPMISIQTARGCPFGCDFCAVTTNAGRKLRKKPITNVRNEIETINPSRIFFADDNIIADPEHARDLFEVIRPMKKRWACQMSTTAINYPELIQLAAEAGCHETFVGVETLDEENLASVHKKFNKVEQYAQLFTSLRKVGILGQASMIFGFDNDTPASLRKTIDVVMNWDINYLYVSILTPLPGTPFYDRMKRDGRIIDDDWSNYDCNHCVIQPKQMSPRELTDLVWEAYERFYSVKGIVDRLWRFKREYVKFFPRDMALEELFFQIYCHRAVNSKQHPFSLGLNRESPV